MNATNRKAAKAAFKERKGAAGIYAVRCIPTRQVWVGAAPNLETIQNRIWFALRHGDRSFLDLQAARREHGIENLTFEELERFDDDVNPLMRKDLLKARAAHWQETLQAEPM
jgi:hypothetical protein